MNVNADLFPDVDFVALPFGEYTPMKHGDWLEQREKRACVARAQAAIDGSFIGRELSCEQESGLRAALERSFGLIESLVDATDCLMQMAEKVSNDDSRRCDMWRVCVMYVERTLMPLKMHAYGIDGLYDHVEVVGSSVVDDCGRVRDDFRLLFYTESRSIDEFHRKECAAREAYWEAWEKLFDALGRFPGLEAAANKLSAAIDAVYRSFGLPSMIAELRMRIDAFESCLRDSFLLDPANDVVSGFAEIANKITECKKREIDQHTQAKKDGEWSGSSAKEAQLREVLKRFEKRKGTLHGCAHSVLFPPDPVNFMIEGMKIAYGSGYAHNKSGLNALYKRAVRAVKDKEKLLSN